MRRAAAWTGGALLVLVLGVALLKGWERTPAIEDDSGRPVAGAIASLERVVLGGVEQTVLIRGASTKSPILLWLHGGPGNPAMFLAHAFQRPLERDFLVVHWDNRGAGKSYEAGLSAPGQMRVSRLLEDARELVELLQRRFGPSPVIVVGHSFGTYLGVLLAARYPSLVAAYVGVAQGVDEARENALADDFVRRCARERGDTAGLAALERDPRGLREEWLFSCDGELVGARSPLPLIWLGLRAPEYTLMDIRRVMQGLRFTHRSIVYDVINEPLGTAVTRLEVPVWVFAGRRDYNTPGVLAAEWLERLEAPRKTLVWFEASAHFPFLEEPERFYAELRRVRAAVAP